MTEALPLTATALLPFVALPFMGVMTTGEVASAYYSPILFLILGGAFLALAIERTGMHRRLALAIIGRAGKTAWGLLFAFMAATAILSMIVSTTSTTLIMVPIAIAVLAAGGVAEGETKGFAGAPTCIESGRTISGGSGARSIASLSVISLCSGGWTPPRKDSRRPSRSSGIGFKTAMQSSPCL